MIKSFLKIFLAILLLITLNDANAQTPSPVIPEFTFYKFDKTAFAKKDVAKNRTSFFVFFDTECDHCRHGIQYINQHYSELKKIPVYLISLDSKEKVNSFLGQYGKNLLNQKNILLLQDSKNEFIRKFSPRKYPSLFLYSDQQKLLLYDDDETKLPVFFDKIKSVKK